MSLLCRLGWHRWGRWGCPEPLEYITDEGSFDTQGQRTYCLRCGLIKVRVVQ